MDYTNKFIDQCYADDRDIKYYKMFIKDLYKELIFRYGVHLEEGETLESKVQEILEKGNYTITSLNNLIRAYIDFCKAQNLTRIISENNQQQELFSILGDYESQFIDMNGLPEQNLRSDMDIIRKDSRR